MPRDHWDHPGLDARGRKPSQRTGKLYGLDEVSPRLRAFKGAKPAQGPSSIKGWLIASAIVMAAVGIVSTRRHNISLEAPSTPNVARIPKLPIGGPRRPEVISAISPKPEAPFPPSGYELRHKRYSFRPDNGPVEIDARLISPKHVVVRIYDWDSDQPVSTIYMDRGAVHKTVLPPGNYRFRIAVGDTWEGDQALFGPATRVQRTEKPSIISRTSHSVTGFVLQLSPPAGNLPAEQTSSWDF